MDSWKPRHSRTARPAQLAPGRAVKAGAKRDQTPPRRVSCRMALAAVRQPSIEGCLGSSCRCAHVCASSYPSPGGSAASGEEEYICWHSEAVKSDMSNRGRLCLLGVRKMSMKQTPFVHHACSTRIQYAQRVQPHH
jgi:hypothetical protein